MAGRWCGIATLAAIVIAGGVVLGQAGNESVYAVVVDNSGLPVTGLQPADFEVRDKGKVVPVATVSRVESRSVLLLLDVSGSMVPRSSLVVDGAALALRLIPATDTVRIGTFANDLRIDPPIMGSREAAIEELRRRLMFGNASPLFDSLLKAIEQLTPVQGRRVILLISDGDDTSSRDSEKDVIARAQREDHAIVTVALERIPPPRAVQPQPTGFSRTPERLGEETGGGCFRVPNAAARDGMERAVRRAVAEFAGEYRIEFTPAVRDNKPHQLEVRARRSGLTIRARRRYVPVRR